MPPRSPTVRVPPAERLPALTAIDLVLHSEASRTAAVRRFRDLLIEVVRKCVASARTNAGRHRSNARSAGVAASDAQGSKRGGRVGPSRP
jgi:hypothetical protein